MKGTILMYKVIADASQISSVVQEGLAKLQAQTNIFSDRAAGLDYLLALIESNLSAEQRVQLFSTLPKLTNLKDESENPMAAIRRCLNNLQIAKIEVIGNALNNHFRSLGYRDNVQDFQGPTSRPLLPFQLLTQLGWAGDIRLSNGIETMAIILTSQGIKDIKLYSPYNGREPTFQEKGGSIVGQRMCDQICLYRDLVKKYPELKDVLGLYNVAGAYEVLEQNVSWLANRSICRVHAAEEYKGQNIRNYDPPSLIQISQNPWGDRLLSAGLELSMVSNSGFVNVAHPTYGTLDSPVLFGVRL